MKVNFPSLAKSVKAGFVRRSPEILTGLGIAGMIGTVVWSVKSTPKALTLIEEKKKELDVEKLTPTETIKTTYKCYIPAAVTGAVSVACLIGANSVNSKRNAALAAALTISENSMKEYSSKVVEELGEKKEKAIRDEIAKDKIEKDPVSEKEVIVTGKGDVLCYDTISGRYFKSDIDKIKRIQAELNQRLILENYISMNEFYYEIGLPSIKIGDDLGWNVNDGTIDISFSSQLADEGTPCLVVDFSYFAPRYDYRGLM
ncbi:MAG: DUF6353 family protein [Lachnospiraceae bacterium]|nr:DUF6353 family protein [Lachnospiraceae bacterium]